ncbi:MAG TPA: hypothetical protein VKA46_33940 [Gemmataceae bacterium]|nr:hypothetical protein [Gemmataceae bacterium]
MSKARFDTAFRKFLKGGEERVRPKTFFQLIAEIERERAQKPIQLRARLVGGKLKFEPSSEVAVHGNEIVVGNQRIVVDLK